MSELQFEPLTDGEHETALSVLDRLSEHPFLFATITGTHQYGFTSPDSDIDVRGAYVAPNTDVSTTKRGKNHASFMGIIDDREVDGVVFEIDRYVELVLKGSGNLIEELFSPVILMPGDYLEELRAAVRGCLSRRIIRHYLGFFDSCIKKLRSDKKPPEVKTALYAQRLALTGIKLLKQGRLQAHLPTLAEEFELDHVEGWIAMKVTEHEPIPENLFEPMIAQLMPWREKVREAASGSVLPVKPPKPKALHALVERIRSDFAQL